LQCIGITLSWVGQDSLSLQPVLVKQAYECSMYQSHEARRKGISRGKNFPLAISLF
jgi:hypothetical protein